MRNGYRGWLHPMPSGSQATVATETAKKPNLVYIAFTPFGYGSSIGGVMSRSVINRGGTSYQLASSHLITTCATLAALILFVAVGCQGAPERDRTGPGRPARAGGRISAQHCHHPVRVEASQRIKHTLSALKFAEQEALDNAYTDHTTGLANRRALLRELDRQCRNAPCKGALILFDLDHFKKVNDLLWAWRRRRPAEAGWGNHPSRKFPPPPSRHGSAATNSQPLLPIRRRLRMPPRIS